MGVPVTGINKIAEGSPHVVDYIRNREVDLVINTPTGSGARRRLRDPNRGGPPGDSVRDDDDRRLGGGSGDLRPAERGAEPRRLQELHEQRRRLETRADGSA